MNFENVRSARYGAPRLVPRRRAHTRAARPRATGEARPMRPRVCVCVFVRVCMRVRTHTHTHIHISDALKSRAARAYEIIIYKETIIYIGKKIRTSAVARALSVCVCVCMCMCACRTRTRQLAGLKGPIL
jgi:hypothetical protein